MTLLELFAAGFCCLWLTILIRAALAEEPETRCPGCGGKGEPCECPGQIWCERCSRAWCPERKDTGG